MRISSELSSVCSQIALLHSKSYTRASVSASSFLAHPLQQLKAQKNNFDIQNATLPADLVELAETYAFIAEESLTDCNKVNLVNVLDKVILEKTLTETTQWFDFQNNIHQDSFLIDFGILFQRYAVATNFTETNLLLVKINLANFEMLCKTYLSIMNNVLTIKEKSRLVYAIKYTTYGTALRFLNLYFKTQEFHFAEKSLNQFTLLHQAFHKEEMLQEIVNYSIINH